MMDTDLIHQILHSMVDHEASDLFITYGHPPALRIDNKIVPLSEQPLSDEDIQMFMEAMLTEDQIDDFESGLELNTVKYWRDLVRVRINAFKQQQHNALALRRIKTDIPSIASLNLPPVFEELIMQKRGLVLVVGQTGSGKSTTLAAMVGHRNANGSGHIITIEDPIEFVHQHQQCIISQRDVGLDTYSLGIALKNALRQSPDVILIGEIRDRETMEQAIAFAETGHLCVSTLHSNNANQALERILNFFPVELHPQVLANLSFNLRGIVSQRLVDNIYGSRSPALEILLNEGVIRDYIHDGEITRIKEAMEMNSERNMITFDQSLLELYRADIITQETALREADSASNLRLKIKQIDDIANFSSVKNFDDDDNSAAASSEF